MLRIAILTNNVLAGTAIEQMVDETNVFQSVYRCSPIPPPSLVLGLVRSHSPAVILFEVGEWEETSRLAGQLKEAMPRCAIVGFLHSWNSETLIRYEEVGVTALLAAPFSPLELEACIYRAVHLKQPLLNANIVAFLPAKAGSGSSTAAVNTAAALANGLGNSTLLIETDRRSGVLSIILNAEDGAHLSEVLGQAADLTGMAWHKHIVSAGKLDLLLANPSKPGPLPTWVNYYHLLMYVDKQYQYVLADLPEVINSATAEVVRAARAVFIVCEPELPSLRLAALRRAELESFEIASEKIKVIVTRWERGRIKEDDIVAAVGSPIFATLPNDYREVKNATLESRLVARESAFGKACLELARNCTNLESTPPRFTEGLLKRLSKLSW